MLSVRGILAGFAARPLKWKVENDEMRSWRIVSSAVVVAAALCGQAVAGPFVVFPQAGQLVSPDGRFVLRNVDREAPASDFVGTFHALWLTELATGRSRKLCDYIGPAAVAWSRSDFLVVTQYLSRRTSRALVFSVAEPDNPVVLDQPTLTRLVPAEPRPSLRDNNHIFIEASRLEEDILYLHVWGYGQHDAGGFRWHCEYALQEDTVSCKAEPKLH
jgi:hypothetical protein